MDNSHTHVTVKRIEKIPSHYYAQEITPRPLKDKKIKVQIGSSLLAEHRRLSDALYTAPAFGKDFSGTKTAKIKDFSCRFCEKSLGFFKNLHYYLLDNAKKLLFSLSVSTGIAATACVVLMCTCSLAYTVTIDGREIGTIKNKSD
ncbi:MAG: hypothetical protein IKL80_02855, partial [Clostridia bacterium]|nr:hypothetical protein [Clostridia bacterium]